MKPTPALLLFGFAAFCLPFEIFPRSTIWGAPTPYYVIIACVALAIGYVIARFTDPVRRVHVVVPSEKPRPQ